jgi:hypothetical protein
MKTRAPTPEASSPGTRTSPSVGPPRPEASINRNAAASGDPNRALMAAKLPAAPTTWTACCGPSFLASRTTAAARPPPSAIKGASGPMTAPSANPASAARATPGSSEISGGPLMWNPSAGECPPRPGRNWMASPTSTPARPTMGSGHHIGSLWKPSAFGR